MLTGWPHHWEALSKKRGTRFATGWAARDRLAVCRTSPTVRRTVPQASEIKASLEPAEPFVSHHKVTQLSHHLVTIAKVPNYSY